MSEKKDIFEVLNKLDEGDIEYFKNLSEKELKQLPPYVLMRWLSGTRNSKQVILVNELVNSTVFNLHEHNKLLWKLLMASSDGQQKKYKWMKKGKKNPKFSNTLDIIKEYYNCSRERANEYLNLLDCESVVDMAESLGEQDDIIKKIKKEWSND